MSVQAGGRPSTLDGAVEALARGGLVVHPTETVYGIGCTVHGPGVERLRESKGRTKGGFVVLIPSADHAPHTLGRAGERLARAFWPGPLTLVCDDPEDRLPPGVKAADGSVAVRVCGHAVTRDLVARLGVPMVSTSANRPGAPPASIFSDAMGACEQMGLTPVGLDAGRLPGAPPSTLVDVRGGGWVVVRSGAIPHAELERVAGPSGGEGGGP